MSESRFRLHQFQANAPSDNGIRCDAGDWVVQWMDNNDEWHNYDGPYAPHEKATATRRLAEIQASELPQLFDDLDDGDTFERNQRAAARQREEDAEGDS